MNRISSFSRLSCFAFALLLTACATQEPAPTAPPAPAPEATSTARTPAPAPAKAPSPPYYSVQLATVATERQARANFGLAGDADFIRAENRNGQYALRVGAWRSKADATQAMERYKAQGVQDAYVIHCHTQPAFIQP